VSRAHSAGPRSRSEPSRPAAHKPVPRLYATSKRVLDVSLSILALLALSPLLALVAAWIKLHDGGPVLFWQWRAGRRGRAFLCYKLRSMCEDAETRRSEVCTGQSSDSLRFKMKLDPRMTRPGVWIRRFSLDEVPQLWNVIRGELSLVGPRPPLLEEVARYTEHQRGRLEVEQGLTCTWQVSGRSLISFEDQVELDLRYIREQRLAVDLRILLRTLPAILSGRGAY
jgi:lipopolysaccharide/colanic/teichoic acid biosynthesis glycosyltransferase